MVLPDGTRIPNDGDRSRSPSGTAPTPIASLDEVAAAGRRAGPEYRRQLASPEEAAGALPAFLASLFASTATAGRHDYQRRGSQLSGLLAEGLGLPFGRFQQRCQFMPIANINVGLYAQQAGLTLEETLEKTGWFARHFSSNRDPRTRYGLDERTEHFIREGYRIGQSGVLGTVSRAPQ